MELVNPHTRTIVVAHGDVAERLQAVGFKPVRPVEPARRGRPKKK